MYELSKGEVAIINNAVEQALLLAKKSPYVVDCDVEVARQFLSRELLILIRDGWAEAALAQIALSRLRGHLQKQQSAQRLAQKETDKDERAA